MMTEKVLLAPSYIDTVNDGEFTFVGVLRKYYDDESEYESISHPWKAKSTKGQYARDYVKRLIPELDNCKPLSMYTIEDLHISMKKIQRKNNYNEANMRHYLYLFSRVYKAGVNRGLFEDKLFLDILNPNEESKKIEDPSLFRRKLKLIRKSLSISDEKKILDWFSTLDPKGASGEEIGFALMFFIPSRNQEVCGLNFGDVRLLSESKIPSVLIYKTTMKNSNRLKPGGKTSNAMRIIPLHSFLYEFIKERQKTLEESVKNGEILLKEGYESIDKMPIVCRGKNYFARCETGDISRIARQKFGEFYVGMEVLRETTEAFFLKAEIEEEDPTAYLLRRNNCRHLACLGFSEAEMQYLVGHAIESPVETRNYFVNEEHLSEMYERLKKHPFNVYYNQLQTIEEIGDKSFVSNNNCTAKFHLLPNGRKAKFHFELVPNEFGDVIEILADDNLEFKIETNDLYINSLTKPSIDVSEIVNKCYRNNKGGNDHE